MELDCKFLFCDCRRLEICGDGEKSVVVVRSVCGDSKECVVMVRRV